MTSGTGVKFSVVIPNRNGRATLEDTLEAVFAAGYSGLEVIVADDASSDNSPQIAARYPVKIIRQTEQRGASSTRNAGAAVGGGEILVFIDSDVIIPPDTFSILAERFRDPGVSGVIGLLQPLTRYPNLCSQYKNFYMHYTYLRLPREVSVFYTSLAAIRRDVFEECGGFDASYRSATIEDMEFGVRLTGRGHKILLEKKLQVEHNRYYSLLSLLKTGFRRAGGLAKIALRDRLRREEKTSYVTTAGSFLVGIVLSWLVFFSLLGGLIFLSVFWLIPAALAYLLLIALNFRFLRELSRRTRPSFFPRGCGLILVDLFVHGGGVLWGVLTFFRGQEY
jgi:glycosyltransferase involved in cell wall biosynthesis